MLFRVGDLVKVLKGSDCPSYQWGREYIISDVITDGLIQVDVPETDCSIFYTKELQHTQEDNIADWESDYYDSWASDDYQSERDLPPTHDPKTCGECVSGDDNASWCENDDWKQKACENITAVQKAYQEGLNASIENAYQEANDPFAGLKEYCKDKVRTNDPRPPRVYNPELGEPEFRINWDVKKPTLQIIPELMSSCLSAALAAKMNGTLISAGITEVGTYGAIIYKKFLEELEK